MRSLFAPSFVSVSVRVVCVYRNRMPHIFSFYFICTPLGIVWTLMPAPPWRVSVRTNIRSYLWPTYGRARCNACSCGNWGSLIVSTSSCSTFTRIRFTIVYLEAVCHSILFLSLFYSFKKSMIYIFASASNESTYATRFSSWPMARTTKQTFLPFNSSSSWWYQTRFNFSCVIGHLHDCDAIN